jgi:hypothetical protein
MTIREMAMLLTLLLNFGAIVWGAATLSATVAELRQAVSAINTTISQLSNDMNELKVDHTSRLNVLEKLYERGDKTR